MIVSSDMDVDPPDRFVRNLDQGVVVGHKFTLPRTELLLRIRNAAQANPPVLVAAPPGSGKSGLIDMLCHRTGLLHSKNIGFVRMNLVGRTDTPTASLEAECLALIRQVSPAAHRADALDQLLDLGVSPLIIVDDAQCSESFLSSLVKSRLRVLAFASYNVDVTWSTPYEFKNKVIHTYCSPMLPVSHLCSSSLLSRISGSARSNSSCSWIAFCRNIPIRPGSNRSPTL